MRAKTRRECRREAVERLRKLREGKRKIHSIYSIFLALLEEVDADFSAEKDFEKLFYMLGEDECTIDTISDDARDWPENQRCSKCGSIVAVIEPYPARYCPNCGAKVV